MQHIKNLLGPKILLFLSFLYTLFLTAIALTENDTLPDVQWWEFQDKVGHLAAYIVLGCAWGLTLLYTRKTSFWNPYFIVIFIASIIYGTVIEVLQSVITTTRVSDFWDVVANTIGVIIGVVIAWNSFRKYLGIKK